MPFNSDRQTQLESRLNNLKCPVGRMGEKSGRSALLWFQPWRKLNESAGVLVGFGIFAASLPLNPISTFSSDLGFLLMAFASTFRRLLAESSTIIQSRFSPVRFNSTITSPKLFVSGTPWFLFFFYFLVIICLFVGTTEVGKSKMQKRKFYLFFVVSQIIAVGLMDWVLYFSLTVKNNEDWCLGSELIIISAFSHQSNGTLGFLFCYPLICFTTIYFV